MWNPFARREVRASYTDALVSLLVREASGSGAPTGQAHATAAAEAGASVCGRHALAAARLEPEVAALSPDVLATISPARLILDGESRLWVIDVEGRMGSSCFQLVTIDVQGHISGSGQAGSISVLALRAGRIGHDQGSIPSGRNRPYPIFRRSGAAMERRGATQTGRARRRSTVEPS